MTDFLLFLGKLVVVGVAGSISFFVFSGKGEKDIFLGGWEVQCCSD